MYKRQQHYRVEKTSINSVKNFIKSGETVIASVAPSFASAFGKQSLKIPAVLRHLGFTHVEDSGITTKPIFDIYNAYANEKDNENYITSMCPTINHLIQKHYPEPVSYTHLSTLIYIVFSIFFNS